MKAGILVRIGMALLSVGIGWMLCFALYLMMANGSSHDKSVWALWTAAFCLVGWIFVGLPLAIVDPNFSSTVRAVGAVLIVGVIGVVITAVFFRSIVNVFSAFAFVTASLSMAVYVGLCRMCAPSERARAAEPL